MLLKLIITYKSIRCVSQCIFIIRHKSWEWMWPADGDAALLCCQSPLPQSRGEFSASHRKHLIFLWCSLTRSFRVRVTTIRQKSNCAHCGCCVLCGLHINSSVIPISHCGCWPCVVEIGSQIRPLSEWIMAPGGAARLPGRWRMLSRDPHLEVTWLRSIFLVWICTCRGRRWPGQSWPVWAHTFTPTVTIFILLRGRIKK